eukprot:TRINITY_DN1066_c0_g1_i2.p2 TRINITY_DN1066_c0_g1~~TRINITY_DN1066_c0_g1_i2.p2  ORF type:complete len:687 (+),score=84.35 TRINITY_DN1066_c0_g1_i2:6445-8505(+)
MRLKLDFANTNSPTVNVFSDLTSLANTYHLYTLLAALCVMLLFFWSIDFFTFSSNMSTLLTVISRAKVSLFFFILMFMLLLTGFAFAGYIIFGLNAETFRSIGYAFMTCFRMSVGGTDYPLMQKAHETIAPIFFVIFILLFFIVLFNMFTSIIGVNYEETVEDIEKEEEGNPPKRIVDLIENELQREFDEISENEKPKEGEARPEDYKERIIAKMPILYRIFAKLISKKFDEQKSVGPDSSTKEIRPADDPKQDQKVSLSHQKEDSETVSPLLENFLRKMNKQKQEGTGSIEDEQDLSELEKDQITVWMETLDKVLFERSERKLRTFDLIKVSADKEADVEFYPKERIDDLSEDVKEFVFASKMSRTQVNMWDKYSSNTGNETNTRCELQNKYKYWIGMDALFSEYYDTETVKDDARSLARSKTIAKWKRSGHEFSPTRNITAIKIKGVDEKDEVKDNNKEQKGKENTEEKKEKDKSEEAESVMTPVCLYNKTNQQEGEILINEENPSMSDVHIEIATGVPLVPKRGNLTSKGMFISPEYTSKYAQSASTLQRLYWEKLCMTEKIKFWLFYLTGKQRAKLWTSMKFSDTALNDYLKSQIPLLKLPEKENLSLQVVWERLTDGRAFEDKENSERNLSRIEETPSSIRHKIALAKRNLFSVAFTKQQAFYMGKNRSRQKQYMRTTLRN